GSYPTEDGRRLRRGLIWRVAPFATRSAVLSPQVESRFCVGGRRMGFVLTALRNGLWHAGTVLAGVVFVAAATAGPGQADELTRCTINASNRTDCRIDEPVVTSRWMVSYP